jgi:hypothetical protein
VTEEPRVTILEERESDAIRARYLDAFVNKDSKVYRERISVLKDYGDGPAYRGYLWDCLKDAHVVSYETAMERLRESLDAGYVMWDLHSSKFIKIESYWKFPKRSVLRVTLNKLPLFEKDLPEDVYVFDSSYRWTNVFTHEYSENGNRWCLNASVERTVGPDNGRES